jgi:membrane protease YdiL (CAAX protease family)
MAFFAMLYGVNYFINQTYSGSPWGFQITNGMAAITVLLLFIQFRRVLHRLLTLLDGVGSLRVLTGPIRHKMTVMASLISVPVFVPTSIPHMVGAFIYVTTFGLYLSNTDPGGFNSPTIPLPMMPLAIDQLISYNGVGLVVVSLCGVGIFVARKPGEVFARLGWQKPTVQQVGIGIGLIAFSFAYDLVWSLYTHNAGGDMATQISGYNAGTFSVSGGMAPAILLALATAICAGIGEETLIRGALQPALGIIPAAFLHGILHAQFSHAPTLILQVAIWSCCMGIVRRFTNTTTTIIGHAGFNLVTTFLFAFNP